MNPNETEKKRSSLERSRFYLVWFGLLLKGTVRTFSFRIKVGMKTRKTQVEMDLCFQQDGVGGGEAPRAKTLKRNWY